MATHRSGRFCSCATGLPNYSEGTVFGACFDTIGSEFEGEGAWISRMS